MADLKRYLIEREIPGVGAMSIMELCGAARASNQAIDQIGADVQWQHSYVAGEKTFCVYLAKDAPMARTRVANSSQSAAREATGRWSEVSWFGLREVEKPMAPARTASLT